MMFSFGCNHLSLNAKVKAEVAGATASGDDPESELPRSRDAERTARGGKGGGTYDGRIVGRCGVEQRVADAAERRAYPGLFCCTRRFVARQQFGELLVDGHHLRQRRMMRH